VSEREKTSFSELDKMRREKRRGDGDRRPRGEKAQARSRAAVSSYKRKVEERLFGKGVDAARHRLEERLRESHGSPAFRAACKEYVRTYGFPRDVNLLVLFLDLDDEREVLRVLDAIDGSVNDAPLEQRNLLRSRLRNLAMSASSDALADAAADLVTRL
jgi:hypothetical protein